MGSVLKIVLVFVLCVAVAEPLAERAMGSRYAAMKDQLRAVLIPLVDSAWSAARAAWSSALRARPEPARPEPARLERAQPPQETQLGPRRRPAVTDPSREAATREVAVEVLDMLGGLDPARKYVVTRALSLVGTPYVWGGESSRGADCSGLVFMLYEEIGIGLPRRSKELFRATRPVRITEVEPGDLVFFQNTNGRAGHVGVFVGRGYVVHASSSRGEVVVDTLEQVSATNGLNGIRRVVERHATQEPLHAAAEAGETL